MSLTTTIGVGTLIGGVAAFAVYAAAAPSDEATVSAPVRATFAPVPTPTVTQTAEGCEPPAVLTRGECLITEPGPTVVVRDPAPGPRATAEQGDDGDQRAGDHDDDDAEDHEDEDHDDDDHESGVDDEDDEDDD